MRQMFRLLKAALTMLLVVVLVAIGLAWFGLEQAARRSAETAAAPWGKSLRYEGTSTRLLPPSLVLENAVLVNAEGDELLRAKRVVLPLLPGAWTGRGAATASPRLEKFTLTLDVPRDDAANWAEALSQKSLPKPEWWSGREGTVVVRVGADSLVFDRVTVTRRKYSFVAEGRVQGVPGSIARFDGAWDPADRAQPKFAVSAGPFDASPWSAWLLPDAEGRVRGGHAVLAGTVSFPRDAIAFDGKIDLGELIVEGADAMPGPFEAALQRGKGSGTFAVKVDAPLAAGNDWRARVRDAVRTSSSRSTATR